MLACRVASCGKVAGSAAADNRPHLFPIRVGIVYPTAEINIV